MKHDFPLAKLIIIVIGYLFDSGVIRADEKLSATLLQTFVDEFVSITPGDGKFPAKFEMGCDEGSSSERPRHVVTMTGPFAIAKYEVPQNLYESVMGANPSRWKGPRNSVEMMSWEDANDFCKKVTGLLQSRKLILDTEIIRLPSEAEWEYCCRAGTTTRYSFGDKARADGDVTPIATILNQYGWHTGNAQGNDPPVGALKPNPWGLYDMHGYLWEFTADPWTPDYRHTLVKGNASKPATETESIVIRSGSWKDDFEQLTSFSRRRLTRLEKDDAVGFRCVKSKRID